GLREGRRSPCRSDGEKRQQRSRDRPDCKAVTAHLRLTRQARTPGSRWNRAFICGLAAWLESTIEDQVPIVDDVLAFSSPDGNRGRGALLARCRPAFLCASGDADYSGAWSVLFSTASDSRGTNAAGRLTVS